MNIRLVFKWNEGDMLPNNTFFTYFLFVSFRVCFVRRVFFPNNEFYMLTFFSSVVCGFSFRCPVFPTWLLEQRSASISYITIYAK